MDGLKGKKNKKNNNPSNIPWGLQVLQPNLMWMKPLLFFWLPLGHYGNGLPGIFFLHVFIIPALQFWGLKQVSALNFASSKPSWFYRSLNLGWQHGGCWKLIKRKPRVPSFYFYFFFSLFLSISQFKTCSNEDSVKPVELHTPTVRRFPAIKMFPHQMGGKSPALIKPNRGKKKNQTKKG